MAKEGKKGGFLISLLVWTIVSAGIGYGAGIGIAVAMNGGWSSSALTNSIALIMLGLGAFAGFIWAIYKRFLKKNGGKPTTTTGKTAKGEEMELHYDSHFLSRSEILNDKRLINETWSSLPSLKNTGSLCRTEKIGGRVEVTMKDEYHSLIIGTTGTGKTSMIIDPAIRIYAHSKEKPCLVITDPKGELYARHARALIEEGYDVQVYDLDNPYSSSRWNPMDKAYETYQRAHNIYKEAKKYSGCTPEQAGIDVLDDVAYGDTWYEFDGLAFPDEESLNKQLAAKKQQLINDATFDIRGIAAALCPVSQGTSDTMWEQGSQDFLYAVMLAMLEDSIDPRLGDKKLRRDQFNFYNLYKIINFKDQDPDNPFGTLRRYCSGRPKTSDVLTISSAIINSAANTTKSYMSVLGGKITKLMSDMGICYATSANDIDFSKFIDKPTAFFIKIPDHKPERHPLATICISQLYRALVDISNKFQPSLKLPRHVYFLMDEFGNLPVIDNFGTMITVSRSRNILFNIVLQSFTQLDTKYGKETSETLKGNFNIQIFLGSEDAQTREAFSKSCGEVQLTTEEETVSTNKGKDSESTTTGKNVQRTVKPLVDPYKLSVLENGTGIVKIFRCNPMEVHFVSHYKESCFPKYPPLAVSRTAHSLEEEKVYYDMEKRNFTILGRPSYF